MNILTEDITIKCVQQSSINKVFMPQKVYTVLERDMEVNRGNKKLLERLVEISKGKHVKKYQTDLDSYLWSPSHLV
jgi:uncharacterized protein with PhoU and TrkA domain